MNRTPLVTLGAFQIASVALAGWVGTGHVLWVLPAAPLVVAGLILAGRRCRKFAGAGAFLLFGVMAVLAAELHLNRLASDWPQRVEAWESDVQLSLAQALDDLLEEGEAAVEAVVAQWEQAGSWSDPQLSPALRSSGIDALAVFGPDGELLAWDGIHQGPFPELARTGMSRYVYREGALFGYLYVTHPIPGGGGAAVSAMLVRSNLPAGLGVSDDDFRARFEAETGATIDISRADLAGTGSLVWDLRWEDEALFSVTLLPPSEAEARAQREVGWSRVVTLLLLLGWGFSVLGVRGQAAGAALGVGGLFLIVLFLPLGRIGGWPDIFSPAEFLLPGPLQLTLGDLLALGLVGALGLGIVERERLPRFPRILAVALGVVLAVSGLHILTLGASSDLLAGRELVWALFQGLGTLYLLLVFGLVALLSRDSGTSTGGSRRVWVGAGLLLAGGLSAGWMWWGRDMPGVPVWSGLFWAIPLWLAVHGLPRDVDWLPGLTRWAVMGILAGTLALPWAWDLRLDARMAAAEERVERLGTRPDPFLEFLLLRAGEQAWELAASDRDAVEVLYGAWSASGLALEGVPLWITYWSPDGEDQEELRVGVAEERPRVAPELLIEALEQDRVLVRRFDLADTHYVGVAPLVDGGWVSVVVPPRRMLSGASPLGPLFSPARSEPDPLVLIPLTPGEAPGETETVRWVSTPEGWKGEVYLAYPDEVYHAHYLLEVPGRVLLFARGTLLLLVQVGAVGLLWVGGRGLGVGIRGGVLDWISPFTSFRGRVTVALFAFFLIPTTLFGTLAYRTLSGAAVRTAEALAERAVEDAASWYFEVDGAMDVLARQVGSDLLLYERGELIGGSFPELVDLGLYAGWLPPELHRDMATGEELMTTAMSSLGGWEYVIAYRRMPGGRVLAAPAPLQAGAMALRQRDITDLIGFSVFLGGVFSILLSLLVGRALSRPIRTLQVASERVGSGNMGVHLPEDRADEFGAVFDAFNRMVDRLAQTRRALLRTSRRTRAIVEEVATGVVALDPQGRVTLANPKAAELLGVPLSVGQPLPDVGVSEGPAAALSDWVERYYRDGLREAGTELTFGTRRIRVRARRVSQQSPLGGVVVSLEDVTDELRTERILAWGEMAQQVAHEVKNPLTPIKLGVQHIRRAWEDGQPDYEEILRRNVDAILKEIDRLSSIAGSFSRYAAPSPAGEVPLEPVAVMSVIGDIFDLYGAGGGAIRFEFEGEDGLPLVQSRLDELKEVLVNLLENARAAMPDGGTVRVQASVRDDRVELRVRDDGTGISPELLPRVFDPHFSTHSTGTGLGLAIVRRLVESWNGTIAIDSQPGRGTTIRVLLLPWTDGSQEAAAGPERSPSVTTVDERA